MPCCKSSMLSSVGDYIGEQAVSFRSLIFPFIITSPFLVFHCAFAKKKKKKVFSKNEICMLIPLVALLCKLNIHKALLNYTCFSLTL